MACVDTSSSCRRPENSRAGKYPLPLVGNLLSFSTNEFNIFFLSALLELLIESFACNVYLENFLLLST